MDECLKLKQTNCKNCYKCIRHCPVKSISFSSNQANIVQEECILCGQCSVICPQNAKCIRDDRQAARDLLAGEAPVYASVAPSFLANYPGVSMDSMSRALTALGFAGAEETALGATIVKRRYEEMIREQETSVIISSCCHTVNLLVQRYYPGVLGSLARVQSPMQAHCAAIKDRHPGAKTVFIGPCLSKKAEAEEYPGFVDCVLTFEELTGWLDSEGIPLATGPADSGGRAGLFPTAGGILRSMDREDNGYTYLMVDGVENCMAALQNVAVGGLERCFIEMSACAGSCIGGPAMERERSAMVGSYIAVDRRAAAHDFPVTMPEPSALQKQFAFQSFHRRQPGASAIEEVLRKMGKKRPEDELNCGSCGYESCREKAAAILTGKADESMCLPYLMDKAQSFSDTIIRNTPNGILVLSESLEIQQLNAAACELMRIRNQRDVLGEQVVCILDPTPFYDVIQEQRNLYERRTYLAEYQKYVMMTVIYDRSYHLIICIMRDVTDEENRRSRKEELNRKTIEITDKVIAKQMRAVQEIASLLGETTAETKVALTKLKETLLDE